jgi:acyl-CoA hydrolase
LDFINLNMTNKTPAESKAILTEIVLPNDTNNLDNLMGGRLLYWMDITASITAQRHCNRTSVTASVNNVSFNQPIPRGSIVTIEGKISRSFNSSMEIFLDVWAEDSISGEKTKCNEAIYTFVAVNNMGRPVKVPGVSAETELEKTRYDGALRRRQLALILSGKMKAADATELKALFS